ncbi:hypothetical protein L6R49_06030 [Myxococcota bacterium]|nr:hypothetical protein [Myxococcota bacterium]
MHRAFFALPVLLALTACLSGDKGDRTYTETAVTEGPLTTQRGSMLSNQSGRVLVPVELDGDEVSFMVTAKTDTLISLEAILDENGDEVVNWKDWLSAKSTESLTSAFYVYGYDSVVNWPVRDVDRSLSAGTWTARFTTLDEDYYYVEDVLVDYTVQTKTDEDLESAVVKVRLVWAEGLDTRNDLQQAVEGAMERWREVWGAAGVTIEVTEVSSELDPELTVDSVAPFPNDEVDYGGDDDDVTVIIGETINGTRGLYGQSGGIPGTLISTANAAVYISWLTNAGRDGEFQEYEVLLLGETMAHEVGHYLGLFHPVEATYDYYDALEDTVECTSWSKCEDQLGENLMFPYPLCSFSDCEPQGNLTVDQSAVMNLYTGAL